MTIDKKIFQALG